MINWGIIGIEVVFKSQEVSVGRKEKKMTLTLSIKQRCVCGGEETGEEATTSEPGGDRRRRFWSQMQMLHDFLYILLLSVCF